MAFVRTEDYMVPCHEQPNVNMTQVCDENKYLRCIDSACECFKGYVFEHSKGICVNPFYEWVSEHKLIIAGCCLPILFYCFVAKLLNKIRQDLHRRISMEREERFSTVSFENYSGTTTVHASRRLEKPPPYSSIYPIPPTFPSDPDSSMPPPTFEEAVGSKSPVTTL